MRLQDILAVALERGASDTHIIAGMPPLLRVHTELRRLEEFGTVSPEQADQLARDMLSGVRYERLQARRDLDFSYELPGMGRFRVNAHYQRNTIAIAFRAIPSEVPSLAELNLPPIIESFVDLPRGLVLITGPTGSGKSTTLASMIAAMNERHKHHVITLEDPVEYELRSNTCIIEQREVGCDVTDFASGLRHALRQDPDIILVGEMRDLETTAAAITAAETGHLVLSTLHTQSAAQTVERIIDIYPPGQQNQIRAMLSTTLQAVVTMGLFKRRDESGMIPACEIMICNAAVRNCIRENRVHEIPNVVATNRQAGMCLFDESLKNLVAGGWITRDQALSRATRPESLARGLEVQI